MKITPTLHFETPLIWLNLDPQSNFFSTHYKTIFVEKYPMLQNLLRDGKNCYVILLVNSISYTIIMYLCFLQNLSYSTNKLVPHASENPSSILCVVSVHISTFLFKMFGTMHFIFYVNGSITTKVDSTYLGY